MQIINFRGDLTDHLAKTEALVLPPPLRKFIIGALWFSRLSNLATMNELVHMVCHDSCMNKTALPNTCCRSGHY